MSYPVTAPLWRAIEVSREEHMLGIEPTTSPGHTAPVQPVVNIKFRE